MKRIFMAVAIFTTANCIAQTPAVKSAFTKNFPGVAVKKWDKEGDKYEANFIQNRKTMSATFAANGALEETETDIKIAELPAAIASYIKTNYNGASIKEAAMITNAKGEKMYEAEVKGKDLLFDMQGKFLKAEEE